MDQILWWWKHLCWRGSQCDKRFSSTAAVRRPWTELRQRDAHGHCSPADALMPTGTISTALLFSVFFLKGTKTHFGCVVFMSSSCGPEGATQSEARCAGSRSQPAAPPCQFSSLPPSSDWLLAQLWAMPEPQSRVKWGRWTFQLEEL